MTHPRWRPLEGWEATSAVEDLKAMREGMTLETPPGRIELLCYRDEDGVRRVVGTGRTPDQIFSILEGTPCTGT